MVVNDVNKLYEAVCEFLGQNPQTKLIAVDGWEFSGKTTNVSKKLSALKDWTIIEGDTFITPNMQKSHQLDLVGLAKVFANNEKIIFDSIRNLEILESINRVPDLLIFIKRVKIDGSWIHEFIIDKESSEEKLFYFHNSLREQQLIRYLRKYRPDLAAKIIFNSYDQWNDEYEVNPNMFKD